MNVLAVGAHFDDIELGCGGTLARHVQKGDDVTVYVATHSGYSNPSGKIIRSREVAKKKGNSRRAYWELSFWLGTGRQTICSLVIP